jgi:hypothetical protein
MKINRHNEIQSTAERLRQVLSYDPATGIFVWLVRTARKIKIGDVAGSVNDQGYIVITVDNIDYRAHRLAWLFQTNEWPTDEIDHRDGARSNNIFSNLREATRSQNCANVGLRQGSTTGVKGVYKKRGKFYARITINGAIKYLGTFDTQAKAASVRAAAEKKYHGEFAYKAANENFGEFARVA